MATATITSKGQVTIPVEVRKDLGVSAGDRIDFVRQADGACSIVVASGSIRALKGVVRPPQTPVSLEDMEAAINAVISQAGRRAGCGHTVTVDKRTAVKLMTLIDLDG